jgi:pimeloyl-ACP methyl ester carboxylesterase
MQLICEGWDHQSPVYRQVFAHLFLGANARPEAVRAFDELQRTAVSGEQALRYLQSLDSDGRRESDLSEAARSLKVLSLVIHRRNDPLVPLDHSRRLAAAIPGARFISLEGDARWLMVDEAANGEFIAAIEHFTSVRS